MFDSPYKNEVTRFVRHCEESAQPKASCRRSNLFIYQVILLLRYRQKYEIASLHCVALAMTAEFVVDPKGERPIVIRHCEEQRSRRPGVDEAISLFIR